MEYYYVVLDSLGEFVRAFKEWRDAQTPCVGRGGAISGWGGYNREFQNTESLMKRPIKDISFLQTFEYDSKLWYRGYEDKKFI